MEIKIYDTTLRDGGQQEGISYSVEDKLNITKKLDQLGVHYIEGGWPGSNPKDIEYFKRVKDLELNNVKIAAFGSTHRANVQAKDDKNLNSIVESGVEIATIFGKSWDLHVYQALQIELDRNLDLIEDSVRFLKEEGLEVNFDAEHFFDGFKANSEYAIKSLKAAQRGGADTLILCDTNGGTMPYEIKEIVNKVREELTASLGIHAHNDSDVAVANSLVAYEAGAIQIQGTINGYGERCGNANLCSIISNLKLKYGINDLIDDDKLAKLTEVSRYISEITNLIPQSQLPYVGDSAFTHKAGIHVNAILKEPRTYEHINPERIGNKQRVLVSELSGKSNLLYKVEELGIEIDQQNDKLDDVLKEIKELEHQGYHFEGAEASFEILVKKGIGEYRKLFELESVKIITEKRERVNPLSEAIIKVKVNEKRVHTAAEGDGPVNALDSALRKALLEFYPELEEIHLIDYKVRVLDSRDGTASQVRVLIKSSDGHNKWGTVGASTNIIEASWQALVDSIEYGIKLKQQEES